MTLGYLSPSSGAYKSVDPYFLSQGKLVRTEGWTHGRTQGNLNKMCKVSGRKQGSAYAGHVWCLWVFLN